MSKSQIFFISIGFFILALMATNPSLEEHRDEFRKKYENKLNSIEGSKNKEVVSLLSNIFLNVGDGFIDKLISRDNYLLFSITNLNFGGVTRNIGVGILGKVYTPDYDELAELLNAKGVDRQNDDQLVNTRDPDLSSSSEFYIDSLKKDSVERVNKNLLDSFSGNPLNTNIVRIGSQVWMTRNLDTDTFRNSDKIYFAKNRTQWDSVNDKRIAAYCYYGFDIKSSKNCGKLYNWFAVNDKRGLAPFGWSIPGNTEWKILINFVGENDAGTKLKSKVSWAEAFNASESKDSYSYRKNGTDQFGFNCLHCGSADGAYGNAVFWSKTSIDEWNADVLLIGGGGKYAEMWEDFQWDGHGVDMYLYKKNGFSVRCIKDK